MTVGLLRDRARTFTTAAADPVDGAGARHTALRAGIVSSAEGAA